MQKAIITCEVTCGCCGGVSMVTYKNPKSIRRLKQMTEAWRFTDTYGNTCPDCLKQLEKEN